MNRLINTTFECNQCEEVWTMYSNITPESPWCPYCGYSENELENKRDVEHFEEKKPTEVIVKKENQTWSEDRMTEKMCTDGWWNPITKGCIGTGNGFKKEKV